MQVIIISSKNARHKHLHISIRRFVWLATFILIAATTVAVLSRNSFSDAEYLLIEPTPSASLLFDSEIESTNSEESEEKNENISYYAKRLGQLQAESIRLNAIAEKMAEATGVDISVFELSEQPAQGGLDSSGDAITGEVLRSELDKLSMSFKKQSEQLSLLGDVYLVKNSITSAIPQGKPVLNGWISSGYGYRTDPFSGKKTMHRGIDFAGRSGSKILAVADGIVSWTGTRNGYGKMIDIDHGNGYISRYAHNKKLIVLVGARIKKGDPIALMGSTGRSTGPHVHFEILRDGKVLNPYNFVQG
jgi:murein DD-endopeptidase MepM/ murein hydrolase activator NlpD